MGAGVPAGTPENTLMPSWSENSEGQMGDQVTAEQTLRNCCAHGRLTRVEPNVDL